MIKLNREERLVKECYLPSISNTCKRTTPIVKSKLSVLIQNTDSVVVLGENKIDAKMTVVFMILNIYEIYDI